MQYQLARRLAERLLKKSIYEWAAERVAEGQSFDRIARALSVELGTEISRETARRWYYDSARGAN